MLGLVVTWMGDCLRTSKPSRYITNTKVNSAFHSSVVKVAGNTMRFRMTDEIILILRNDCDNDNGTN